VYLLQSGWVARSRFIETGRRQIIFVFLPGDLMGIKSMLIESQPDTIECLTHSQVRTIDRKHLLDLVAEDHAASVRIMFQLAEDERRLHNWVAALGKAMRTSGLRRCCSICAGDCSRPGWQTATVFRCR